MSETLIIHPKTPQVRLLKQVVAVLDKGGVVICPTDSYYALICRVDDKSALKHIYTLRQLDRNHLFSLLFHDLSQLSSYALISDMAFKLMKDCTPGPYTFVLKAESHTTRHLSFSRRRTIGARFPKHPVVQGLLATCDYPLVSVGLSQHIEDDYQPQSFPEIDPGVRSQVALGIDAETCCGIPTTIIDLSTNTPEVLRVGHGTIEGLL